MDRIGETYNAMNLGEQEASRQRYRELQKAIAPLFAKHEAEDYLESVRHRLSLAGWMERKKVVWIPTMLAIGLAIAIVWGVR